MRSLQLAVRGVSRRVLAIVWLEIGTGQAPSRQSSYHANPKPAAHLRIPALWGAVPGLFGRAADHSPGPFPAGGNGRVLAGPADRAVPVSTPSKLAGPFVDAAVSLGRRVAQLAVLVEHAVRLGLRENPTPGSG